MRKSPKPNSGKLATGIVGFDELSFGGLPQERTTLCVGGPGCGKTIFALQTLVNQARQGIPGIFVAFEESSTQLIENTKHLGWNLSALLNRRLAFLDARFASDDIRSGTFDLNGLLAAIKAKAGQMKARHLVFDGIDVLLNLLNNPTSELVELYRLRDWLQKERWTSIITAKVDSGDSDAFRDYGYLQYMTDCVVQFRHHMEEGTALRSMRILKYRGSPCFTNEVPMEIYGDGVQVARGGPLSLEYKASEVRLSSGIPDLDTMLGGGLFRGHSMLITGQPGTAKTTLSGSFAQAACLRKERVLYVSFDESEHQIIKNLRSVQIRLQAFAQKGRLRFHSVRSEGASAEYHFLRIQSLLIEHRPSLMVIDPLTALLKAGGAWSAAQVVLRLLGLAKAEGITVLMTALTDHAESEHGRATESLKVSTMADTWIHLSYLVRGGERNRGIDIIKSRGTRHSNQIRELLVSSEGIRLAEVFTAGGEVLMGTSRFEYEASDRARREAETMELAHHREEFKQWEEDARKRIAIIENELRTRRMALEKDEAQYHLQDRKADEVRDRVRVLRGGRPERRRSQKDKPAR